MVGLIRFWISFRFGFDFFFDFFLIFFFLSPAPAFERWPPPEGQQFLHETLLGFYGCPVSPHLLSPTGILTSQRALTVTVSPLAFLLVSVFGLRTTGLVVGHRSARCLTVRSLCVSFVLELDPIDVLTIFSTPLLPSSYAVEDLSEHCAATNRWTFHFTSWPLNLYGGAARYVPSLFAFSVWLPPFCFFSSFHVLFLTGPRRNLFSGCGASAVLEWDS